MYLLKKRTSLDKHLTLILLGPYICAILKLADLNNMYYIRYLAGKIWTKLKFIDLDNRDKYSYIKVHWLTWTIWTVPWPGDLPSQWTSRGFALPCPTVKFSLREVTVANCILSRNVCAVSVNVAVKVSFSFFIWKTMPGNCTIYCHNLE